MAILNKTTQIDINLKKIAFCFSTHTLSQWGDTKLSQPLSYLIILINFTLPAWLEHSGALLSLLSPSQRPDCPDSGYKFRYDSGRMPPLAFPVGMACQFVFPPNSVMVVFPFKWFQLINNWIYPHKSSLPWLNTLTTTIPGRSQKQTAD